jgi:hypothetical protein
MYDIKATAHKAADISIYRCFLGPRNPNPSFRDGEEGQSEARGRSGRMEMNMGKFDVLGMCIRAAFQSDKGQQYRSMGFEQERHSNTYMINNQTLMRRWIYVKS